MNPYPFQSDPEDYRVTPAAGVGTGDQPDTDPDPDGLFAAAATEQEENVNITPPAERADSQRWSDGRYTYP